MNWIRIEDKLPETGEKVLACRPHAQETGDSKYTVLKYEGFLSIDLFGTPHGFERNHFVSHWCRIENPEL